MCLSGHGPVKTLWRWPSGAPPSSRSVRPSRSGSRSVPRSARINLWILLGAARMGGQNAAGILERQACVEAEYPSKFAERLASRQSVATFATRCQCPVTHAATVVVCRPPQLAFYYVLACRYYLQPAHSNIHLHSATLPVCHLAEGHANMNPRLFSPP